MNSSTHLNMTDFPIERVDVGVVSDEFREVAGEVLSFALLPLTVLGIITNLINIRVFLAQGIWKDNTNFGFISLSAFDLLNCVTLIPFSLCYVVKPALDLIQYRTCSAFALPFLFAHSVAHQSSSWTTVYMSVVRSFCVYIPLKVKQIFTPKVAVIVVLALFVGFLIVQLMYNVFTEIVWVFDPMFNKSYAYIVDSPVIHDYLYYSTIFNYHFLSVTSILVVSVTTSLMIRKLYQVKKWRQKNASAKSHDNDGDIKSSGKNNIASKDIELVKSVTTVTVIFIICNLVSYIPATATVILPGVSLSGVNRNLYVVVFIFRFLFDAINSSINFFFYMRLSSRYKSTFASLFAQCSQKTQT